MRFLIPLRRLDYARRFRRRNPGQRAPGEAVYFLHIGKTGGSFVKSVIKDPGSFAGAGVLLVPLGHNFKHPHLPRGSRFVFATRDPATRFVSGFHSRRRRRDDRGRNRWSRAEARAFARFETPNAPAEALSAPDPATRRDARAAMRAIRHLREPHVSWFPDTERLHADIMAGRALRIRQEHLNADTRAVFEALGLAPRAEALEGRAPVHVNRSDQGRALSPQALDNLRAHYAADYDFLAMLDAACAGAATPAPPAPA